MSLAHFRPSIFWFRNPSISNHFAIWGKDQQAHKLGFFEELPTLLSMQPSTEAAAALVSAQCLYSR